MSDYFTYNKTSGIVNNPNRNQSVTIYDLLSEGPIQGLVKDGIFLDGRAVTLQGSQSDTNLPTKSTDIDYVASTNVLTDNQGILTAVINSNSESAATQYVNVREAKKIYTTSDGTITLTNASGAPSIQTGSAFFNTTDRAFSFLPGQNIQVNFTNGTFERRVLQAFLNTTTVTYNGEPIALDGKTISSISIDKVGLIASFDASNNTITLTDVTLFGSEDRNITEGIAEVATVQHNFSGGLFGGDYLNAESPHIVDNFRYSIRNGYRDQTHFTTGLDVGSASLVVTPNQEIKQTDLSSEGITGYNVNQSTCGGYRRLNDEGQIITPDAAGTSVSVNAIGGSNTFNAGNQIQDIDLVRLTFTLNQLIAQKPKTGSEGPTYVELRIFFKYKPVGSSTFEEVLVFGPSNATLEARGADKMTSNFKGRAGGRSNGHIEAQSKSPFVETFTIAVGQYQPFDNFEVVIQKVNPDNGSHKGGSSTFTNHNNSITLKTAEAIIMDNLAYPYSAYAHTSFDAAGFSNIPERQFKIRGLKVQVPTNYFGRHELAEGNQAAYTRNVTTGANAGTYQNWDGKFRGDRDSTTGFDDPTDKNFDLVWTDNPVWIFYDILTNKRYGLGEYINASDINKYELFKVAKFCDELVPDGKGGTEPRFSCNTWLVERGEAFKVIKDFASIFRGVIHWINGQVTLSVNREKQPVYTFSKSNVIDGLFRYQSTRKRTRHNSIVVSWNDPEQMYKKNVEIVEDTNDIIETGQINVKQVSAFGCTSRGQAHRYGKFHLLSELLESEVVTFSTGINAQHLKPGDVIEVQDGDLDNLRYSGRVKSGSSTTVVNIDSAVALNNSGSTYYLTVVFPTGVAYLAQDTATISSVTYKRGDIVAGVTSQNASVNIKDDSDNKVLLQWSGDTHSQTKLVSSYNSTSITVSSAFSTAPSANAIWGVTEFSTSAEEKAGSLKEFIVNDISEDTENQIYSITATEYDRSKFQLVDRGYDLYEVPEVNRPPKYTEVVPAPQNLAISQTPAGDIDQEAGTPGFNLLVSWQHPESNRTGITSRYEFIQHYEIIHNIDTGNVTGKQEVDGRHTSFVLKDVPPGTYKIGVRLINTLDRPSKTVFKTITVTTDKFPLSVGSRIGALPVGGSLSSGFSINPSSGLVTIANSTYTHVNPNGLEFSVSSGNSSQTTQAFSGLSSGETGFLAIDASDTSDPLKALEEVLDFTAVGLNSEKLKFEYLAEVGASNSGISSASGTVTAAQFATTLTGSSTAFTTDYAVGDRIIIASGSTRFFATVTHITSNTSLDIDQALIRAYSGASIFKLSFKPDFLTDTIIARVTNNSGTYELTDLTSQGVSGQSVKTVELFKLNDSTFGTTTAGTFADPTNGVESGWTTTQPALSSNSDEVYMVRRTFTSDGLSPQDSSWSSPVVVARRTDGSPGSNGLRTATGQLFFQQESATAPAIPSNTITFNFSNGTVSGTDIGSSGAKYNVTPPAATGGAATSKTWFVYYVVSESSAGSGSGTLSVSGDGSGNALIATSFTGLVTFSGGQFSQNGSGITTIDGDHITTGRLRGASSAIADDADPFTTQGLQIDLDNNTIKAPEFSIVGSSATFGGTISIGTGNSIFKATSSGIQLGHATFGSAPFRVTAAGALTADSATLTNATVSGSVTASAINLDTASISGTLNADKIQIDDVTIDTDGSGNLIIKSAGVGSTQLGTRAAGAFATRTTPDITIGVTGDPGTTAAYIEVASFGTTPTHGGYSLQNFTAGEAGTYSAFYSGVMEDENENFAGDDQIELLLQVFDNQQSSTLVNKALTIQAGRALGFTLASEFTAVAGNTYQIRVFARERNGLTNNAKVSNNFLQVMRITKGQ